MSAAQVSEWGVFEQKFGPLLVHQRLDWIIYLLTLVARGLTHSTNLQLPPWLQEKSEDDDSMLATLRRLADRQKGA